MIKNNYDFTVSEGYVELIKVLNQKELEAVKTVQTDFGNIFSERSKFNKSEAIEITDEKLKILKNLD